MGIVLNLSNWTLYLFAFSCSFIALYFFYNSRVFSILDVPNHRSMHENPTKKSAGLIFISVFILSILCLFFFYGKTLGNFGLLEKTVPGLFVCLLIGFLDDRYNFSSRRKLFFEIIFFIPYTYIYFPEFRLFEFSPNVPKIFYSVILAGYFIFVTNLCNFMDGLDLYLTLSIFVAVINFFFISKGIPEPNQIAILLLLACLGAFIFFNYPPARLFMGDSGSLPLGYMIAILPFLGNSDNVDLGYGFLLIPVFWVDGVLTIIKRLFKKENIFLAHREHLFQKISLSLMNKRQISVIFSLWNLISIPIYFLFKQTLSLLSISLIVVSINTVLYLYLIQKINRVKSKID